MPIDGDEWERPIIGAILAVGQPLTGEFGWNGAVTDSGLVPCKTPGAILTETGANRGLISDSAPGTLAGDLCQLRESVPLVS